MEWKKLKVHEWSCVATHFLSVEELVLIRVGSDLSNDFGEVVKLRAGWLQQGHPENCFERFSGCQVVVVICKLSISEMMNE